LFSGISGKPVSYMFANTFVGCGKLYGSIPQDLFSGISGEPAPSMFAGTFYNCKGLSGEIPAGLFEKISGAPAEKMFINTFYGCADLTSYIPYGLFSGITGTRATSDFSGTTSGANLDTICPENTYQATINTNPSFNSLDGHPICAPCPDGTTSSAGSTSIEQCFLSSYNIIYDYTNGGSGCANDTYTPGTAKELLCIPTKEGYTFAGWYDAATGGNKIETITILDTGNKTLYAQWRNILCPEGWTSDDDIITDINTQCYQMCSVACIEQACPENASCTNGDEKSSGKKYYGDEETCNAESIECSLDITCNTGYAKTTEDICELKEYTITYELSGGNNSESNPSTYTIESSEITLSSPTKEGYEFVGWYDNSGFTGDQITVIPQGSFGNRTYYAQWKTSLCDLGEYRQDDECLICPENKYCPGDNTVTECPQGLVAPQGNTSIDNCGKIFNIDGEMLYLTQTRQTLPALAVSLGENVYYGKMRPVSQGLTPIHKDTEVYFKANVSGTEYYIYDNTIGE
nr:InlB B-repeat-containing protein [Candidatus Enterousia merdequi]